MPSSYPTSLDSLATSKADGTTMATDHPAHHNDLADAVNKIEAELGTLPKGGAADVKARIAATETVANAAVPKSLVTTAGDILYATASAVLTRLGIGASGTVLKGGASAPSWASIVNADVSATAAIVASKLSGYPTDSTKVLAGDGSWPVAVPATFLAPPLGAGTSATLTANQAYLARLSGVSGSNPISITRFLFNVVTQSGNMDLGIYYTDDESTFTRFFSVGSFAVPAAALVTKTVAAQSIAPLVARRWYVGFAVDNGTASFRLGDGSLGYLTKVTSFPLPASLTGMTLQGTGNCPVVHLAV